MDLALEMGTSVSSLRRSMQESELREWQQYAAKKLLPARRLELYLAQIALMVMRAAGSKDAELSDFLFDVEEDEPVGDPVGAAKEAFGFAPRNKKD